MANDQLAFIPESLSENGIFSYCCTLSVSCSPCRGPSASQQSFYTNYCVTSTHKCYSRFWQSFVRFTETHMNSIRISVTANWVENLKGRHSNINLKCCCLYEVLKNSHKLLSSQCNFNGVISVDRTFPHNQSSSNVVTCTAGQHYMLIKGNITQ